MSAIATSAKRSASSSGVCRWSGSCAPLRASQASAAKAASRTRSRGAIPLEPDAARGPVSGGSSGATPAASVAAGGPGSSRSDVGRVAAGVPPGAAGHGDPEGPLSVASGGSTVEAWAAVAPEEEPGVAGTAIEAG